jgi:hypothetical protein
MSTDTAMIAIAAMSRQRDARLGMRDCSRT